MACSLDDNEKDKIAEKEQNGEPQDAQAQ